MKVVKKPITKVHPVSDDVTVDIVDAAGCDSFPASDPPAWSSLRIGSPAQLGRAPHVPERKDDGTSRQAVRETAADESAIASRT